MSKLFMRRECFGLMGQCYLVAARVEEHVWFVVVLLAIFEKNVCLFP